MRIISWNLNGLLSCVKNNSFAPIALLTPDVICLQEIRTRQEAEALWEYAGKLRGEKPVVICGDFNVAREDIDVYEENLRQYWAEQGYASDERSDLEMLLEMGFTDAFRHFYPDTRSYTWWSNRLHKRGEDRGWRLDYFIVSTDLLPQVCDVRHLSHITGSDHCPIQMEVR